MAISLLKKLAGPWETVRDFLLQDLQKIQTAINGLPSTPTFIEPRSASVLSSPTPSIDTDSIDFFSITRLTQPILSFTMNLLGSPVEGQELTIRIRDDGTPRAITWGSKFSSTDEGILPTTTKANNYLYIDLIYNGITSKWDCVASTLTAALIPAHHTTHETGGSDPITVLAASTITTGQLALARGGTNADLSATGGTSKFLKQAGAGAAITVVQPASSDLSDASNIPLLNVANTFSHNGNTFTDLQSPHYYFNSGLAFDSVDLGTVTNTTINSLSINGITDVDALIVILTQGTGGFHVTSQVNLRGSDHATIIVSDPGTILSTTKGTANKVNVYWDVGNARYEIENKSTISLRIGIFYMMLRN